MFDIRYSVPDTYWLLLPYIYTYITPNNGLKFVNEWMNEQLNGLLSPSFFSSSFFIYVAGSGAAYLRWFVVVIYISILISILFEIFSSSLGRTEREWTMDEWVMMCIL